MKDALGQKRGRQGLVEGGWHLGRQGVWWAPGKTVGQCLWCEMNPFAF